MQRDQENFPSSQDKETIESEADGSRFPDARLERRFRKLLGQLWDGVGRPIPLACQDWAATKAAYRFLSNERVSEAEILAGHFESTRERFAAGSSVVLVLHDTSEFCYTREANSPLGFLGKAYLSNVKKGRSRLHTQRGILMHSSLAVTTDGLPLGLAAIKFWTRKKFKGANALKKKINPTRVPIEEKESYRWLENVRQSTALLNAGAICDAYVSKTRFEFSRLILESSRVACSREYLRHVKDLSPELLFHHTRSRNGK